MSLVFLLFDVIYLISLFIFLFFFFSVWPADIPVAPLICDYFWELLSDHHTAKQKSKEIKNEFLHFAFRGSW
jgi:hypothetical protein